MGSTCENCNGTGIINYDSDLPRYRQKHCPECGGEGVVYSKSFQEIKGELEEAEAERHCMLEPLESIGLDDEEFFRYIKSLEREAVSEVFTLRVEKGTENIFEDGSPYVECLIVFEDKQILKINIKAHDQGKVWAVESKGKWL